MKTLYLFKVGTTFRDTAERHGDFDAWMISPMANPVLPIQVIDVEHGDPLPAPADCGGVAITGSHAMVTDNLPWSLHLEDWLRQALAAAVPILGVCYGHQLLARAAGGEVGYHPAGKEIGTLAIDLLPAAADDPLLQSLPAVFAAHTTHAQSVLRLPPGAILLAASRHEAHHAYRIGDSAWGVQFHPEFTAAIMTEYIKAQRQDLTMAGVAIAPLIDSVQETPSAAGILKRFAAIVAGRG